MASYRVTGSAVVLFCMALAGASSAQTAEATRYCRPFPRIAVMNADGSGVKSLTHNNFATDHSPAWSPDGTRIAFERNGAVFVMDAEGHGPNRLTGTRLPDIQPAWSPDGSRIAFARGVFKHEIYVKRFGEIGATNLTHSAADDTEPAWSLDGSKLAFASNRSGNYDIFLMNADGSGLTDLTSSPEQEGAPAWSPDGRRIAFSRSIDLYNYDIFVMNADGSDQRNLTNRSGYNLEPAWSPDGTRIAFAHPDIYGEGTGIYVMNADGSGQTNLIGGWATNPAWSPAGTKIAFSLDLGASFCCLGLVRCRVPSVLGLRLASAVLKIRRVHCVPGQVRHAPSTRPRGGVIAQYPPPGTIRGHGTCVHMVVSRGRK